MDAVDPEDLPEWAKRMIDRSLMTPAESDADESVVRIVAADLVATLGWTTEQAERVARRTAVARQEFDGGAFDVAEEVQQWLHDTFIDTIWPSCPDHDSHPLWLNDELMWTCHSTGRSVCRLGQLTDVFSVDAELARRNLARLDAEERDVEEQRQRLHRWWTPRYGEPP